MNHEEFEKKFFAGPTNNSATYQEWCGYIGLRNNKGEPITEEMLRKWVNHISPPLECVFCGEQYSIDDIHKGKACKPCKTYKGLVPYIEEWSDWG